MATSKFAVPVPLPIWENDQEQPAQSCEGYQEIAHYYDGRQNKVEIQPVRFARDARELMRLGYEIPIGQSYTIGCAHLMRLILAANEAERMRRAALAAA